MIKKILLLSAMFTVAALSAQDVTDVASILLLARTTTTTVLTITASQGDGSTCTMSKVTGNSINVMLACNTSDSKTQVTSVQVRSSSTTAQWMPFGFGSVLCILGLNPTTGPVSAGTFVSIPANSLAWRCTTNISATGMQTTPVSGSVSWP